MITLGTKAETLEMLAPVIRNAEILPQVRFTVEEWKKSRPKILNILNEKGWLGSPLIARSSAKGEDTEVSSMAGHFCSVGNALGQDALDDAVEQVIASYSDSPGDHQVFLQPMLSDVIMSGVAFTIDPNTGSPYYVVNYNRKNEDTTAVTSGSTNDLKTYYHFKGTAWPKNPFLARILQLLEELEEVLRSDRLDVEFAFDSTGRIYLFQVRPLKVEDRDSSLDHDLLEVLKGVENKIVSLNRPHPYLKGSSTIFGVMPDWNPAEIIGVRPRPLALSLYKEVITDNIWAYQRDNYGYMNLRSFPLLVSFAGLPYIDVRVSFNSFLPRDLNSGLAEKLVNYYIERLIQSPSYHDKVEFEVVFTCYTLDLPERLNILKDYGFTSDECQELTTSLRQLTNRIIHTETGLWKQDIGKISLLEDRLTQICESKLDDIGRIYWLIEDCKRYGTLPFAGLARAGFIAVQLLQSLVSTGILNSQEYNAFLSSLGTISSSLTRDFADLPREDFLLKYGHLRPGTYDILSPRYDEAPDRYFDWANRPKAREKEPCLPFVLSLVQLRRTENLLKEHNLDHDVLGFFDFIKAAIEGREMAKFVFTKSLSNLMKIFGDFGKKIGFDIDACSYADIGCIRSLYASSHDPYKAMLSSITEGRQAYSITKRINLPPLLVRENDVRSFELPESSPNFITMQSVCAHVAFKEDFKECYRGSIMLIPSADPGFDWIFSHGIRGLVTMYGGVNSHMAIRAGELGIPAVIGAGEELYRVWEKAKVLNIDCASKIVQVVK